MINFFFFVNRNDNNKDYYFRARALVTIYKDRERYSN